MISKFQQTPLLLKLQHVGKFIRQTLEIISSLSSRVELRRTIGGQHQRLRRQLRCGHSSDASVEFVCLIDNHDVMLRQNIRIGQRINSEHRMVGDDHINIRRLCAGFLRETVRTKRTTRGTNALLSGHRHRPPHSIRHTGGEVITVTSV